MIKVLIADDEKIQRDGILKHIPWQDYGMTVVGCACDGMEALEFSKEYRPDVLITDIKMPGMNGLVLTQKIKDYIPQIRILIISGYEEFEYARTAIELNAYEFLLKPIKMTKLKEQLERIRTAIEEESRTEAELLAIRKKAE